jgi:hypothetical protein
MLGMRSLEDAGNSGGGDKWRELGAEGEREVGCEAGEESEGLVKKTYARDAPPAAATAAAVAATLADPRILLIPARPCSRK